MDINLNFNISNMQESHKAVTMDPDIVYDVIIIGGGPAAMTAAVYCMRKGVQTALVTKSVGGQVAETASVENYMGFKYIEGLDLVNKFREQFKQFEIAYSEGLGVDNITDGRIKQIKLEDGSSYRARSLIISSGKSSKKMDVPGEKEFLGKGVAYCAICDAPLFREKRVVVVGGGNSGVEAAIDLAKLAKHVTIIQRNINLTADKILIDRLNEFTNIDINTEHLVESINGADRVESITVFNRKTEQSRTFEIDGVFIEIGLIPNTGFATGLVKMNGWGEILIDCACRTNIPGIFAAGDATNVPYKQIIIAAGDGAKAALSACEHVLKSTSK